MVRIVAAITSRTASPQGPERQRRRRASISSNGVYQMLRRWVREAGLSRKIHPRLFRHTFALLLQSAGMRPSSGRPLGTGCRGGREI